MGPLCRLCGTEQPAPAADECAAADVAALKAQVAALDARLAELTSERDELAAHAAEIEAQLEALTAPAAETPPAKPEPKPRGKSG